MTNEIIIDTTKCIYNTFDGGGSQRTICTLDNKFCDCLRDTDCYFKELKKLENEFEGHIEQVTDLEVKLYDKEQECERLKKFLNEIRYEELSSLDIDLDEYETSARQLDYSNIITLVERALGEIDD